jgi:hypothetical protein
VDEHDPPMNEPHATGNARPSGTPLGRAFLIRPSPFNEDLIVAVRAVASVHGDGPLPPIPMILVSISSESRGRFWYGPSGPTAISVDLAHRHRAFAAVHEIGQFLDFTAIGQPDSFASESSPKLAAWRAAAEQSKRVAELRRAVASSVPSLRPKDATAYVESLVLPELWARCYAQYIAIRSGDGQLRAGSEAHRATSPTREGGIGHLLHSDDDDFLPIAETIEALFRRLGWRSGR